jgi:ADP-ribose pyrophosphatase YjhB (NUDIX family)
MKPLLKRHIRELKKRKPPLLVVNAVISREDEVLLIKRGKPPDKGKWVVPGGHVKYNESPENTLLREVREETGLEVEILGTLLTEIDKGNLDPRGYHLATTFLTKPIGGKLSRTREALDIKWFKLGKLPKNLGLGCGKYFQETITKDQQMSELIKYVPPMPMVNQIIYGLFKDEIKILIGKRNKPPHFSEWIFPGGHFSYKETIEEASVRKAKQETGLSVEIDCVIDVFSDVGIDPRSRNVVIYHLCKYKSGKLKESKDIKDFYWHDIRKPLPKNISIFGLNNFKAYNKAKNYLLKKL